MNQALKESDCGGLVMTQSGRWKQILISKYKVERNRWDLQVVSHRHTGFVAGWQHLVYLGSSLYAKSQVSTRAIYLASFQVQRLGRV